MTSITFYVAAVILVIVGFCFLELGFFSSKLKNEILFAIGGGCFLILGILSWYSGHNLRYAEQEAKRVYFVRLDGGEEYTLDPKENELKIDGDWISFIDNSGEHVFAKGFSATARLKDELDIPLLLSDNLLSDDMSSIPTAVLKVWKKKLEGKFHAARGERYYELTRVYVRINHELFKREGTF